MAETTSARKTGRTNTIVCTRRHIEQLEQLLRALKGSLRIMVVDDDEDLLTIFAAHLERCPFFYVQAAVSVAEARNHAYRGPWHCWLVDLYVPRLTDGMKLIGEFAAHVPIVVMSGQSTGSNGFEAGRLGIVGFIDKGEADARTLIGNAYAVALRRVLFTAFPSEFADRGIMKALFEQRPQSVLEWAEGAALTVRTLQRRISESGTLRPGTILAVHILYELAFRYWLSEERENINITTVEATLLERYHERQTVVDVLRSSRDDVLS